MNEPKAKPGTIHQITNQTMHLTRTVPQDAAYVSLPFHMQMSKNIA